MRSVRLSDFQAVWCCDFEFRPGADLRPHPLCMVARDLHTGHLMRFGEDALFKLKEAPFPTGRDALFVAHDATAELGCFQMLGWPLPTNVLDTLVEYRCIKNGRLARSGVLKNTGLLKVLSAYGLDSISSAEKQYWREVALRGGPYHKEEIQGLLDYCQTDVDALVQLLPCMAWELELPFALQRGKAVKAFAMVEHMGVPIDIDMLTTFQMHWDEIRALLISTFDPEGELYEGIHWRNDRFFGWLARRGLPWPRHSNGKLDLRRQTFKDMSQLYPQVGSVHKVRETVSKLRLTDLAVGINGRNRTKLWPFSTVSSRNAPRASEYIFAAPSWLRRLIRPEEDQALAYVDWSSAEVGIAAALSDDDHMMTDYRNGDPHLNFAVRAGAAPSSATKKTHSRVRDLFKSCNFGVMYGMGVTTLAQRTNRQPAYAQRLITQHKRAYPRFWSWREQFQEYFFARQILWTPLRWLIHSGPDVRLGTVVNFPMQATCGDILRLALVYCIDSDIKVITTVHDALLVECQTSELESTVHQTRTLMARASRVVLDGFELKTDVDTFTYPDTYVPRDEFGMWEKVQASLRQ